MPPLEKGLRDGCWVDFGGCGKKHLGARQRPLDQAQCRDELIPTRADDHIESSTSGRCGKALRFRLELRPPRMRHLLAALKCGGESCRFGLLRQIRSQRDLEQPARECHDGSPKWLNRLRVECFLSGQE